MIKGEIEFKFDKGINLRMAQILELKDAAGIVLFASVRLEGKDRPVLVVHEDLTNPKEFINDFYILVKKHGVKLYA